MQAKLQHVVLCGAALVLLASTSASGAATGFQGLDWGASEQAVMRQYAGQVKLHECTKEWRWATQSTKTLCKGPYIPGYDVAGIPFELNFNISASSKTLISVGLSYESDSKKSKGIDSATWQNQYESLYSALREKYGNPDFTPIARSSDTFSIKMAEWSTDDTVIKLESTYSTMGNDFIYVTHNIYYKPKISAAARKL